MTPEHSAEVLSSGPGHKQAAMCLSRKIRVLCKIPSGRSDSAVGHEWNVNESAT